MAAGSSTRNVAPRPGVDCTCTSPPLCLAMPYTVDRPRPVPWPNALVVKNGSKMRSAVAGVHALAGVGHLEHDVAAGATSWARCCCGLDRRLARADGQRAAARHRVARVDDQVQQHLLHLRAVGANGGHVGAEVGGDA